MAVIKGWYEYIFATANHCKRKKQNEMKMSLICYDRFLIAIMLLIT